MRVNGLESSGFRVSPELNVFGISSTSKHLNCCLGVDKREVISFNACISACEKASDWHRALHLVSETWWSFGTRFFSLMVL